MDVKKIAIAMREGVLDFDENKADPEYF